MKIRRWIERTLLLAGVIGLGVWTWSRVSSGMFQDWESWSFDRAMRGESASISDYLVEKKDQFVGAVRALWEPPASPQPPAPAPHPPVQPRSFHTPSSVVGRLAIPRLRLSAMVREGTGESTLTVALGHIPGTALPGEMGNVGVAGHRDTLFRSLQEIRKHDLIRFETLAGNHSYEVESTEIVRPDNTSVLRAGRYPELTLVTCYPFYYVGAAPDRFIVRARLVPGSPAHGFPETPPEIARTRNELAGEEPSQDAGLEFGQAGPHDAGEPLVSDPEEVRRNPALRKVSFRVSTSHSQELASEVLFGVTGTDATHRCVDGWMWVINRRRTIWLRRQRAEEPVVFYGYQDGKKRELMITRVTADSVAGYLLLPEPASARYASPQ